MNQVNYLNRKLFFYLPYLLFFLLSFIYFGFFGDYIGFFQEKSSLFVFSREYLAQHLSQPGSLLIYTGKLLTAFFYYPAAGSLLLSSILCLTAYLIARIISLLSSRDSIFIPLITGTILFYLQTNYQYMIYNSLAFLLQAGFFWFTVRYMKGWLPVFLAPLWYFITGGFAGIFMVMYILYLVLFLKKRGLPRIIGLVVLTSIIIFFSKEFLFFQPLRSLIIFPWSVNDIGGQIKLFIPVAGFISFLPVYARISIKLPERVRIPESVRKIIPVSIPLMMLILIAYGQYDLQNRQYFKVEKMFYEGKYDEVIAFNTRNPSSNMLTIFLNNIALCETGKLNDMLFRFRQSPDGQTLFLKWEMLGEILKRGGWFYYTVGMINEANRWAFENMVMKGHSPEGLKMLTRTELINGNYSMAEKYNAVLKKSLFYRRDAREFGKFLFNDLAVEADPELGEKRRIKTESDFFVVTDDPYYNVDQLLSSGMGNRNAMEYKLAFLMITENYEGIAEELPYLERYGYTSIPVHVEEAAMVYSLMFKGKQPETGNLSISPQTAARFNQFLQTFQLFNNDRQAAEPSLRQRFGNTFWYYAFYR
ncbi:MAG: hypothetical protein K0B05_11915 [Bacteroidales bacterium]|nr:hypothetical protein [Bacteroidales bacterium]